MGDSFLRTKHDQLFDFRRRSAQTRSVQQMRRRLEAAPFFRQRLEHTPSQTVTVGERFHDGFPRYRTLHTRFPPSSVTMSEPWPSTVTPTGLPQTSPDSVTKPVRKSSYSPLARPFRTGTEMIL